MSSSGSVAKRLREMGVALPEAIAPVANYVPFSISGNLLYISGQLPFRSGEMIKGTLGIDVSAEDGMAAARLCALSLVSQLNAALKGDLDRVVRCVRLGGFVACTPEFTDHPKVINGASDFMVEVFGDAGRHARAAVGCSSLPLGAAVEVDAIFEIEINEWEKKWEKVSSARWIRKLLPRQKKS